MLLHLLSSILKQRRFLATSPIKKLLQSLHCCGDLSLPIPVQIHSCLAYIHVMLQKQNLLIEIIILFLWHLFPWNLFRDLSFHRITKSQNGWGWRLLEIIWSNPHCSSFSLHTAKLCPNVLQMLDFLDRQLSYQLLLFVFLSTHLHWGKMDKKTAPKNLSKPGSFLDSLLLFSPAFTSVEYCWRGWCPVYTSLHLQKLWGRVKMPYTYGTN